MKQWKFAKSSTIFAKARSTFSKILNWPFKIAQDYWHFAKVAKFRQIWSHCVTPTASLANFFTKISHDNDASTFSVKRVWTSDDHLSVWPDWLIYWTLGHFLKPLATINLPKYPTFFGNFCKGVKINHFSSEIILGNFYRHLEKKFWLHCSWLKALNSHQNIRKQTRPSDKNSLAKLVDKRLRFALI